MNLLTIALLAAAISLGGCGSGGGGYSNSESEDAAAWTLLGSTALMNGYNAGRSGPMPMVGVGNRLVMCSGASGMMQCY